MGLLPIEMCPLTSAAHVERSQILASRAPNDSCISFPDFQVSDNLLNPTESISPEALWPPQTTQSFVQHPQLFYRLSGKHVGLGRGKQRQARVERCSCSFSTR